MTDKDLKQLLTKLQAELDDTDKVDPDTLKLVRELDDDINRLLESDNAEEEFDNVIDRAKAVETRFAVDHPVAERFLQEIINALARVGI